MEGNHCRLFDENLVRNIMLSTGMSLHEFMKGHADASVSDICDFIEMNADTIIWNTIEDMNTTAEFTEDDTEQDSEDEEPEPL